MRVDVEVLETELLAPPPARQPVLKPPSRRRLDWVESALLGLFGLLSLWVIAVDIASAAGNSLVWTRTDGVYITDQAQYLAWIVSASHHGLISNMFVLHGTPADYLQPGVLISGALAAAGVAPYLALLLWKPVAVVAIFMAVRAYVHRLLPGRGARRAAIAMALFFGALSVVYGSVSVVGDMSLGFLNWGYPFAVLSVAAMVGGLACYETALRTGRLRWAPPLLGAVASLLHPWQGEMFVACVVGGELWRAAVARPRWRLERRRVVLLAWTLGVTGAALVYYAILGLTDPNWSAARVASKHAFPLSPILLALVPLAVPAAFAYRVRPRSFLAAATRAWAVAALAIYFLSGTGLGATPLHAFVGISVPLAALAVEGVLAWRRWWRLSHRTLLGTAAVALVIVPGTAYDLHTGKSLAAPAYNNANFITRDEQRALHYLATDRRPGGVLTRSYLGNIVPAETGRNTYMGDCLWSQPNCYWRSKSSKDLILGAMSPATARAFVAGSRARFVLADCWASPLLASELRPLTASVHRFGCAAVYTLQ